MVKYVVGDATKPVVSDGIRVIAHVNNNCGGWGRAAMKYLSLLIIVAFGGCRCAEIETCVRACNSAHSQCDSPRNSPEVNVRCAEIHLKCIKTCKGDLQGQEPERKKKEFSSPDEEM